MRVLVAEDDRGSRVLLQQSLLAWGYEPVLCADGVEALRVLLSPDSPRIAVLDWMMPELDGLEVCRRIRASEIALPPYLLLLTGRSEPRDIVAGLRAGADDYLTKPVNRDELEARLQVALRVVSLQDRLADRVQALEQALSRVRQLHGLLPICAYCKRIRDDQNYWKQVEAYLAEHADVQFSHGICPTCLEKVMRESE